MIGRDLFMNTIRMFAVEKKVTIAAGISGKIKTAFQLVGVLLGIISVNPMFAFVKNGISMTLLDLSINTLMSVSITIAVIFAIWSGVEYTVKNAKSIDIKN